MNTKEAGLLLVKIQAFDRRTVGRADMEAWAEAMTEGGEIRLPDALEAVSKHFAASNDWLMPNHVIQLVKRIRKARFEHAPLMDIPRDLHQAVERQWIRAFNAAVADGSADPNAAADAAVSVRRAPELTEPRDMSLLHVGRSVDE
jgi:hypothetical protein